MSFEVIPRLAHIAHMPKENNADVRARAEERKDFYEEHWQKLPADQQGVVIRNVIKAVRRGILSPNTQKKYARRGQFPKGAGPAIKIIETLLDQVDDATRRKWYATLTPQAVKVAETIRLRKPYSGPFDPVSRPFTGFLKNHDGTIGTISPKLIYAKNPKTILIVGDGLSANISAFLIHKVNPHIRFIFLERNSTLGGRMSTQIASNGTPLEEGAMRMPKSGKHSHYFFRRIGIGRPGEKTIPFPNIGESVDGKIDFMSMIIDWKIGEAAPDHPYLKKITEKFNSAIAPLRKKLDLARANHDLQMVAEVGQQYVDTFGHKTIPQFLEHVCGFDKQEIEAFQSVGLGTGRLDEYFVKNVSALEFMRELTADLTVGQGLLPNGARNAVERIGAEKVDHADGSRSSVNDVAQRHYGFKVNQVLMDGSNVLVRGRDKDGKDMEFKGDAALLTAHPGALREIDLATVLQEKHLAAIKKCDMMDSSKLIASTPPFWLNEDGSVKKNMVVAMVSDKPGMSTAYLVSYPARNGKPEYHAIYFDYRWSHRGVTKKEYFENAKEIMAEMVPEMKPHLNQSLDDLCMKEWRFDGGAFRELSAQNDHLHADLAYHLSDDNKAPVIVVNADSNMGGYTETAATEAIHGAAAMTRYFGGTVYADMPKRTYLNYEDLAAKTV